MPGTAPFSSGSRQIKPGRAAAAGRSPSDGMRQQPAFKLAASCQWVVSSCHLTGTGVDAGSTRILGVGTPSPLSLRVQTADSASNYIKFARYSKAVTAAGRPGTAC